MKFKNLTGTHVCFSYIDPLGSQQIYEIDNNSIVDIPEAEAWRAKAHGLINADASEKAQNVADVRPEPKPIVGRNPSVKIETVKKSEIKPAPKNPIKKKK